MKLNFNTLIFVCVAFSAFYTGNALAETVIYDNTTINWSGAWYPPGSENEIIDFGESDGGYVSKFKFGYTTELSNPGTITITFYQWTSVSNCPGSYLQSFNISGLSGPGAFVKEYVIPENKRFQLRSGDFGYSFEFTNSSTGTTLASGGDENEDMFWYYDDFYNEWWYANFSGNPHAGFYMKVYAAPKVEEPVGTYISGYKFDDSNANGNWDTDENGLPGWMIYLDANGSGTYDAGDPNAITDSNGKYLFDNLSTPATYNVREVIQDGWNQTFPGGDGAHVIVADPNQVFADINFGNSTEPLAITFSGIVQLSSGVPIEGVRLEAFTNGTTPSGTYDITDQTGYYEITLLPPWTGTIIPSKNNYEFSESVLHSNQTVNVEENFTGSFYYGGGSGSEDDPYQIWTANEMNMIGLQTHHWDCHFKLMADINMSAISAENYNIIGSLQTPFSGTFDGNQHEIRNFSCQYGNDGTGLFEKIESDNMNDIVVWDLTMTSPTIIGGKYTGTLAGRLEVGKISSCKIINAEITGAYRTGGLVGYMKIGEINNSSFTGQISGSTSLGGIVGEVRDICFIRNCNVNADIFGNHVFNGHEIGGIGGYFYDGDVYNSSFKGSVIGTENVGGILGKSLYGNISSCFTSCTVEATGNYAGGIIGLSDINYLRNNYTWSDVSGTDYVGGIAGRTLDDSPMVGIYACYSISKVSGTGSRVGGLTGSSSSSIIWGRLESFWDIETSGIKTNTTGIGLNSESMKIAQNYINEDWDFENTWRICDGMNYPRLQWQLNPGDLICPDGVGLEDFAILAKQWMLPKLDSDVVNDGVVNLADWSVFADAFGSTSRDRNYNADCDIAPANGNGIIDMNDMILLFTQWLEPGIYNADIAPLGGDGNVDTLDMAVIAENWLKD